MTSEYVRQELRAVVGARTGASGVGGGGGGGARPPDLLPPPPPDLESLGLSFEMPPAGTFQRQSIKEHVQLLLKTSLF